MKRHLSLFFLMCLLFIFVLRAEAETLFTVEIPLRAGAQAVVLRPDGERISLGKVKLAPSDSRWPAFTASKWAKPGTVAATAVNAIHLSLSVEKGRGRILSLVPEETLAPAAGETASVVLEGAGGQGLFGAWTPPVGTPVFVRSVWDKVRPLSANEPPKKGETLVFPVEEQRKSYMVDVENRPGGRVLVWDNEGFHIAARVIRPVKGVGRFGGGVYQDGGRLRANHTGVIDVCTSPRGEVGGFQIMPYEHAATSGEMANAWILTQWMIIAAPDHHSFLPATLPLFGGALVPGPSKGDRLWDLWSTYGRNTLVLCRINGGPWQNLPTATGKNDTALDNVTHLRFLLPFSREIQPN